jgi:signal transduction histidine kinase
MSLKRISVPPQLHPAAHLKESQAAMNTDLRRFRRSYRVAISYLLAVLLPPLGSWLAARSASLRAVPFALHFIPMAGIAALGGLYPGLFSFIVGVVTRPYFTHLGAPNFAVEQYDLTRAGIILSTVLLISFINSRLRRSEQKLGHTLLELQERTDELSAALLGSKCACWTLDLDSGRSARWFRGSFPIFGRPFDEVEALASLAPLLIAEDRLRLSELRDAMLSAVGSTVFEFRVQWPNGDIHTLEMRGTRLSKSPCVWRGITMDITDRALAETALLRSEKLAAMGRLASTVAHEINNPLEAVTNLLYLARTDEDLPEPTRSYLSTAERELARLSNITRLTLGFVRTSGRVADTDVAKIVDEVLSIFEHRLEAMCIHVERNYTPGVCVHIAPHELRQIATNLVSNAVDAAPGEGGKLAVHVLAEGKTAVLLVEDNGSGVDEAHATRIFEPFFSTKEEVGTGIGLWVTRELVEKAHGKISLEGGSLADGIATRFRIEFPLPQTSLT